MTLTNPKSVSLFPSLSLPYKFLMDTYLRSLQLSKINAMEAPIFLVIFLLWFSAVLPSYSVEFNYNGFNQTNLLLDGAIIKPDGALRLTNNSQHVIGHAFHPTPIQFFINSSSSSSSTPSNISSFSTYFVFQIVPSGDRGGHGLAFTLSPSPRFPGADDEHFLGLLNSLNNGNDSNHIFAVEFDTVNGYQEPSDSEGNHVGININSMLSEATEPASYYVNGTDRKEEMKLEGEDPVQAWIEYDSVNEVVNVTVSPLRVPKPSRPLISKRINLSSVLQNDMYIGFSAATGEKSSSHYILGWSFRINGTAPELDFSKLPLQPIESKSSSFKLQTKALIGALSVLVILLLVTLFIVLVWRRRIHFESLEDWELDCPHRFKFRDLHAATKGFKDSELLGVGGFGAVYKGVLPTTGAEVAVKKISSNSIQGLREFAAEVECLGRLRHKNLVNLQGWCKRKNDLLLVYDYIPNGSLNSLLLNPKNVFVLSWEQRFNILKGIAAGLLYLHEEWAQVVIHRDVKSSNVLIDADMNGRLGDFGLARLYDHDKNSHTTHVVGTIGYIAPELAQTGKASASSDVFAYGVLLLEVACGRGPIVSNEERERIVLVDWVINRLQTGEILDAGDPMLGSAFVVEEMELVIGLGLLCSHPKPESRPTMRQIVRYLNGDDLLPGIDELGSVHISQGVKSMSRFLKVISVDEISTSCPLSSTGRMSSGSFAAGR